MLTRTDVKRMLGYTPNFKYQPSEEERIRQIKELIEKTERDLQMYKEMLEEKDLW